MNLKTAIELHAEGTSEGACKAHKTKGHKTGPGCGGAGDRQEGESRREYRERREGRGEPPSVGRGSKFGISDSDYNDINNAADAIWQEAAFDLASSYKNGKIPGTHLRDLIGDRLYDDTHLALLGFGDKVREKYRRAGKVFRALKSEQQDRLLKALFPDKWYGV